MPPSHTPTGTGDWETLGGFAQSLACKDPYAIEARRTDNSTHSLVTHITKEKGFWCVNSENAPATCADFEVRFCCPEEYHNPCDNVNLICAENQHIVYQTLNDTYSECTCECDAGYILKTTTTRVDGNAF